MSQKMLCPVCNSYTSSVLSRVRDGEPCPDCGTPAEVIWQVNGLRERHGETQLVQQVQDATVRAAKAEAEAARLRSVIEDIRDTLRQSDL